MSEGIFFSLFFQPLYNGLIFLLDLVPWFDAGVAIVVFTLIIKLVLFPLSKKSIQAQVGMKSLEADMAIIKEKYKDNKEEQARQIMKLYKEKGVNPFSGFLVVLIQLPILIALYWVFLRGGFSPVKVEYLYSAVPVPEIINLKFLGLVDISSKSYVMAILAGIVQYFQVRFSMPIQKKKEHSSKGSFAEDFAHSMQMQMRYVIPVIMAFIAYQYTVVVALYLITSSLFAVGQELYVRKKFKKE